MTVVPPPPAPGRAAGCPGLPVVRWTSSRRKGSSQVDRGRRRPPGNQVPARAVDDGPPSPGGRPAPRGRRPRWPSPRTATSVTFPHPPRPVRGDLSALVLYDRRFIDSSCRPSRPGLGRTAWRRLSCSPRSPLILADGSMGRHGARRTASRGVFARPTQTPAWVEPHPDLGQDRPRGHDEANGRGGSEAGCDHGPNTPAQSRDAAIGRVQAPAAERQRGVQHQDALDPEQRSRTAHPIRFVTRYAP